ncbi:MAG: phospho-N-acetylmuramoyl-pentapeptide-transferase [bacterium]
MYLILTFFFSAIFCWLISVPIVWALKVFKLGQNVRLEGPSSHHTKAGTPTMGGIPILLTTLIFAVILINIDIDPKYFALILLFMAYSALGFADDLLKIQKKQNEGLTGRQKLFWQFLFAAIFASILIWKGHNNGIDGILKLFYFNAPWLYFPFVSFLVIGTANAVNLTDGLDGLAASTLAIAFSAFAVIAYNLQANDPGIICATAAGATLAFLWFNIHPAEVFMGDIGSLGLGALLAGTAIILHKELILAIIGGVFLIEALSVIAQVSFYKTFKRRLFKMAPLHHHFELLGLSEPLVVTLFVIFGIIFAVAGVWCSAVL